MASSLKEEQTCPVCLKRLNSYSFRELGRPSSCEHIFCFLCILEWSKNVNTCPVDRLQFNQIQVYRSLNRSPVRTVAVQDTCLLPAATDDATYCEVCNQCTRENQLLLCDGCDRGYHLDCLSPPLSEVPEDDWYCMLCETIVQSQYNKIPVTSLSADEDSDYIPQARGEGVFKLDLSSDVDITGSGSESTYSMVMSLDSESDSFINTLSSPWQLEPSDEEEDVYVDVVTGDPGDIKRRPCSSPSLQISEPFQNGCGTSIQSLVDDGAGTLSSDSDVVSTRPKRQHSNKKNFSSWSSDASSLIILGQSVTEKKRAQRSVFSESGSEDEDLQVKMSPPPSSNGFPRHDGDIEGSNSKREVGWLTNKGKGKGPLESTKRQPSKKSLRSSIAKAGGTTSPLDVDGDCSPLSSKSTLIVIDSDGEGDVEHTAATRLRTSELASDLSHKRSVVGAGKGVGAGKAVNGCQKPPMNRRRKRRRVVRTVNTRRDSKKQRRRRRRRKGTKKGSCGRGIVNPFAVTGVEGTRSRARTAATHTPRQTAMRAAVAESYRHDNKLEGLEWARAVLAHSATPRSTNFSHNFTLPVSGYVERRARSGDVCTTSPAGSRMYGFTPTRSNKPLCPSLVSSGSKLRDTHALPGHHYLSNATASPRSLFSNVSTSETDRENLTLEQRREANRRVSKHCRALSQVLIVPVKYHREIGSHAAKESSLSSSSEPVNSDLLGEMCRGLEVLENKESIIHKDGTIIPHRNSDSGVTSESFSPVRKITSQNGFKPQRQNLTDVSQTKPQQQSVSKTRPQRQSLTNVSQTGSQRQSLTDDSQTRPQRQNLTDDSQTGQNLTGQNLTGQNLTDDSQTRQHLADDSRTRPQRQNLTDDSRTRPQRQNLTDGSVIHKLVFRPDPLTSGSKCESKPLSVSPSVGNSDVGSSPHDVVRLRGYTIPKVSKPVDSQMELDSPSNHGTSTRLNDSSLASSSKNIYKHTRSRQKRRSSFPIVTNSGTSKTRLVCSKRSLPTRLDMSKFVRSQATKHRFVSTVRSPVESSLPRPPREFPDLLTEQAPTCGSSVRQGFITSSSSSASNSLRSETLSESAGQLELGRECENEQQEEEKDSSSSQSQVPNSERKEDSVSKIIVAKALDKHFDRGEITNRQYKRILDRAHRKVQEGLVRSSYIDKNRVVKLVADYVKAYKYLGPDLVGMEP